MARSHIAVALGAALVASLIIGQLMLNLRVPSINSWHQGLKETYNEAQQFHFQGGKKQSGEQADDPSSYLVGVGKADITGYGVYT